MTSLADRLSALQALLVASRADGPGAVPNTLPPTAPRAASAICAGQAAADVEPGAASLLARLISQLPSGGQRPLSVQFLPCCPRDNAGGIARTIACAATVMLGRTLLLDALTHPPFALAADLHRGPIPDVFLPGLYHRQIGAACSGFAATRPPDLLAGETAETGLFRFIVLDSPAPSVGGPALAFAPLCSGSVLVVLAGVTRLAAVRAAASDLTASGAHLLGTILLNPRQVRA